MIGIFDSGVGGLGIYKKVKKLLPKESILYLADSKNCPYGEKNEEEIKKIALENTKFLINKGCNIIVIACNTASTIALEYVRKALNSYTTSTPEVAEVVSIVGVVPVVKTAAEISKNKRIGILATKKTVESKYLRDLMEQFCSNDKGFKVYYQAANELVKLVEGSTCCHSERPEGVEESFLKRDFSTELCSSRNDNIKIIRKYLQPLIEAKVDIVTLGCTHFPFLRSEIEKIMGAKVTILDSNGAVARQVGRIVARRQTIDASKNQGIESKVQRLMSNCQFYTSGNPQKVKPVIEKLLGEKIDRIRKI